MGNVALTFQETTPRLEESLDDLAAPFASESPPAKMARVDDESSGNRSDQLRRPIDDPAVLLSQNARQSTSDYEQDSGKKNGKNRLPIKLMGLKLNVYWNKTLTESLEREWDAARARRRLELEPYSIKRPERTRATPSDDEAITLAQQWRNSKSKLMICPEKILC